MCKGYQNYISREINKYPMVRFYLSSSKIQGRHYLRCAIVAFSICSKSSKPLGPQSGQLRSRGVCERYAHKILEEKKNRMENGNPLGLFTNFQKATFKGVRMHSSNLQMSKMIKIGVAYA